MADLRLMTGPGALYELKKPWMELLRESDHGSPFMSWEWMSA